MTTTAGADHAAQEPRFLSAKWLTRFVVVAMVLTALVTWLLVAVAHVGRPHNAAGTVLNTSQGITPARSVEVALPWGTLDVGVTKPRTLAPKDVAQFEADGVRRPPDGGRFVGLTWMAGGGPSVAHDLTGNASINTHVSLLTRGHTYPLDTPSIARRFCAAGCIGVHSQNEAWVALPGDASDLRIGVEYDGVTQTVDARTGVVSKGRAASLYEETETQDRLCTGPTWPQGVQSDGVRCAAIVQRLPWVAGLGWAPNGRVWTVAYYQLDQLFGIETTGGDRYDVADNLTTYAFSLPGSRPALRTTRGAAPRPALPGIVDPARSAGSTAVFSSPVTAASSKPKLVITARYAVEATDRHTADPLAYATATWTVAT